MNALLYVTLVTLAPPAAAFQGTFIPGLSQDDTPAPRRTVTPATRPAPNVKTAPVVKSTPAPVAPVPAERPARPTATPPPAAAATPSARAANVTPAVTKPSPRSSTTKDSTAKEPVAKTAVPNVAPKITVQNATVAKPTKVATPTATNPPSPPVKASTAPPIKASSAPPVPTVQASITSPTPPVKAPTAPPSPPVQASTAPPAAPVKASTTPLTTPVKASTTAVTNEKPPEATKKATPTCSGATADIKEMIASTIETNIFNLTWTEDHPVVGGKAKFRIFDKQGAAQIEMINSSNDSVGTSPARVCTDGKTLRVGLQTAKLNFGSNFFAGDLNTRVRDLLQTNTQQTAELPLIVSAGPGKLIHIRDGFDNGKQINSTFSAN